MMNLNTNWLLDKGKDSDTLVLFAHGAGADMHSDFMADYATLLSASGPSVLRFNFPYMVKRGEDGKRRPPDRAPALLQSFEQALAAAVAEFAPKRLFLMGKSMGGRMAAMLAANDKLAMTPSGVICLGYPFLPPKKTEPRLEPLWECASPLLILQGERDSFGKREQLASWALPEQAEVRFITDGDHSFVPRKSSGTDLKANLQDAVKESLLFIGS
ncbi:alpha/beta fold hydrolase [Shewanella algae]|uniref:alpha/beta fold hydrolase n=1 Tax=Shewanella algae TaxID=38313 RepID=UPI003004F506